MVRFLPPEFPERDFRRGEQAVWDALAAQLPSDAAVFYSLRLPEGSHEREIDFVVAWPGVGLAVLEVKGGHVERADDGSFWTTKGTERKRLRLTPMEQASEVRHLLTEWLLAQRSPAARARIQHLVVLPHTDIGSYDAHDFPEAQVVDRGELPQLAARLMAAVQAGAGHEPLTTEACEHLCATLMPAMQTAADPAAAAEAEEVGDSLSADLADRVAEWRYFPRLKVIGGAGTGKTWLAMAQARRLAAEGQRVALVCYSRGLAAFLQREAATWRKPPAYVGGFHELATHWGGPAPEQGRPSSYWEEELPRALGELASGLTDAQRFDAVVVDEGQDFGERWWSSLNACLRDPSQGLYVFLDNEQRVFTRRGEVPIDTPPICLGRNLRNTQRIANVFGSLTAEPSKARGLKGPRVRFVQCAPEEALERADDAMDELDEIWEPGQLALLTTHHRHPVQVEVVEGARGYDGYWDDYFAGDSVLYGSVSGFKGLERSCVVLAVNGFSSEAQAREMLYVGLSRARSQLVVVGDLTAIAAVGGEGVRRRLEAAEQWQPPRPD